MHTLRYIPAKIEHVTFRWRGSARTGPDLDLWPEGPFSKHRCPVAIRGPGVHTPFCSSPGALVPQGLSSVLRCAGIRPLQFKDKWGRARHIDGEMT
jgi:hypothetical protein